MNFLIENWYLIAGAFALAVIGGIAACQFFKMPTKEQIKQVKEWLLYAVTMAEAEFGRETGKLKLRYVYDLFLSKFPWMAKMISFDRFSALVDGALDEMRNMLETNDAAKNLTAPPTTKKEDSDL